MLPPTVDRIIDLYKVEYEQASEFYRDLYKATWQVFSYLSVVAGGIIAFAGQRLPVKTVFGIVVGIFWFWMLGSFEPANRYGDMRIARLAAIERALTELVKSQPSSPGSFDMSLFQDFAARGNKGGGISRYLRVRHVVRLAIVILTILWLRTTR